MLPEIAPDAEGGCAEKTPRPVAGRPRPEEGRWPWCTARCPMIVCVPAPHPDSRGARARVWFRLLISQCEPDWGRACACHAQRATSQGRAGALSLAIDVCISLAEPRSEFSRRGGSCRRRVRVVAPSSSREERWPNAEVAWQDWRDRRSPIMLPLPRRPAPASIHVDEPSRVWKEDPAG